MKAIVTIGEWTFEIKSVIARKTSVHGQKYTGVLNLTNANGTLHMEALHCDEFTKEDAKNIKEYLRDTFGTTKYVSKRGHSVVVPTDTSNLNKGNTNG